MIDAAGGEAGLWMLAGPSVPLPARHIWEFIGPALGNAPYADCVTCEGRTVTRAEFAAAITDFPWRSNWTRVGLVTSRSISSLVATLAVWKNRGVYVPIAVEYSRAQQQAIIAACHLDAILSDRSLCVSGYAQTGQYIGIDGIELQLYERLEAGAVFPAPDGLCYIAHTSGSSGAPKGVMLSHAGLINRLLSMQSFLAVTPHDRFIYKTPALFDVHLWEFLLPLLCGGVLTIYPEDTHFSLFDIAELICRARITIAGFAPVLLGLLLKMPSFISNNSLRSVLCGGEAWDGKLGRAFHASLPGSVLFNSYGPTETTMVVTNWAVPDSVQDIALGAVHQNTIALVQERERFFLDGELQVRGELLIGGVQVGLGYVGDHSQDRFHERVIDGKPVRFYATGDLVCLNVARGLIFFRGRDDSQVKINGVRVEIDEVEAVIRSIENIENCAAFVMRIDGHPQLWVLFTASQGRPVAIETVKAECLRRLSALRTPCCFKQIDHLPLRPSGKLDRAILPALAARSLPVRRAGPQRSLSGDADAVPLECRA